MTLKITQAAREAAAEFSEAVAGKSNGHDHIADCRKGRRDDTFIVQAFQRAMNQAADEALERAGEVGKEAAKRSVLTFLRIHDGNRLGAAEIVGEDTLEAIRALKGQQP